MIPASAQPGSSTVVLPEPTMIEPTADEMHFFDRVRRALDNRETYNEFLKLVNYFTQGIIDMRRLVQQSYSFLGDSDLLAQLKDILGWDASWERNEYGEMNGVDAYGALYDLVDRPAKSPLNIRNGPSYRKLPYSVCACVCVLLFFLNHVFRK